MGSQSETFVEDESDALPDRVKRRALIDRVASSSQFARSARLRDFLLYVGNESLKDGIPEIHEQEIGVRVFGRSPSYDRSQDNIVRVNATELRKRIDTYFFSGEGVDEPWIFSIPKGSYGPVFRCREVAEPRPLAIAPEPVVPIPVTVEVMTSTRKSPVGWIAATTVLALMGCFLLWQNRSLRKSENFWDQEPTVASFWTDLVKAAPQTDIVLPDASVMMSEEMLGREVSLNDYLERNFIPKIKDGEISSDRRQALQTIFDHSLVIMGDFQAAQQVLALTPIASSLRLTSAFPYNVDSIRTHNVILIGGKKANPWVGLIDGQMNFSLDYDQKQTGGKVTNRHPVQGELPAYVPEGHTKASTTYSVLAYLPNPGGTGRVLLLAGADSNATDAAAKFITSEDGLRSLKQQFHSGEKFPYFEVLLKISRLGGASFSTEPLAYRIYRQDQ
jgi:hypothetical protein